MYVCMRVCVYVYVYGMHICKCVYVHVYRCYGDEIKVEGVKEEGMYVCMYVCMYVKMCVCIFIVVMEIRLRWRASRKG